MEPYVETSGRPREPDKTTWVARVSLSTFPGHSESPRQRRASAQVLLKRMESGARAGSCSALRRSSSRRTGPRTTILPAHFLLACLPFSRAILFFVCSSYQGLCRGFPHFHRLFPRIIPRFLNVISNAGTSFQRTRPCLRLKPPFLWRLRPPIALCCGRLWPCA